MKGLTRRQDSPTGCTRGLARFRTQGLGRTRTQTRICTTGTPPQPVSFDEARRLKGFLRQCPRQEGFRKELEQLRKKR
eukprot:425694-Prorocentrum_lima.AAC.1